MLDYEQHLNDKNQLKAKATVLGDVNVPIDTDLEQMRSKINEIISSRGQFISSDWCFIDSCTAERFFRIDRAQENLHYVTDIANEDIFILEATGESLDLETALPSPNSDFDHNEYIRSDGKSVSKISIVITDESNSAKSSIEDEVGRPSVKELLRKMEEPISKSLLSKNLTQSSLELGFFHRNFRNPLGISSGRVLEAAKSGDLKKVKELHSEGYSLLSQSETGETALHLAAHLGHSHLVKYLITTAPHQIINMTDDKRNETALHRAVMSKHKNITIMLVAAGASLTKPDRNGRTPIDLSTDPDITLYLKSQEEFQKKAGNSYLAE